jgi:CubicO group peptidase (beta-lactamase class C family)
LFVKKDCDLMQRGVTDGVFPGGVLVAAHQGRVLFSEAFGLARITPERPVTVNTVFDLASLTKPLATTLAIMLLVQETKLDLDQQLASTIPFFMGTDKQHVTVRQLLSHTSGLPDYRPYYEELLRLEPSERKDTLRSLLLAEPLIHEPGKTSLYSDLDFMLLEWLVELVTETPLDRFVQESVYAPLGLEHLFFVRLFDGRNKNGLSYAATEDCPWRKEILDGKVHDDNAYVVGGVGGHAGLFATAIDVHILLQELLNTWNGAVNSRLLKEDVVRTFLERQSDAGSWALGFDTPTRPDSSSGKYFSDQSVGHLGFTGTSFWMDLEKEVIVVLFTNRIHPTRDNERIKDFRPLLHDAVMEAILSTAA